MVLPADEIAERIMGWFKKQNLKNFILPLLLILIAACNNSKNNADEPVAKNDSATSGKTEQTPVNTNPVFSLGAFDKNNTPLKDSVKGNIINGAGWTDANGIYTVLLSQTENKMINGQQNQRIYASCFKNESGKWTREWLVQDFIENCEVDATCEFFPQSLTVTDNDHNNTGEVTFLYKLSCKGDVSPDQKKLIMYEGTTKYAIRGTTILLFNGGKEGGEKKTDPSFNTAPKSLLDFANLQWDKFGTDKY